MENKKRWRLYAGLSGGFGGASYIKTIEASEASAFREAEYEANEIYDRFEGMHGLFNSEDELEQNPELTEEELGEMEDEDRERWLDYHIVEETEENKHEDE